MITLIYFIKYSWVEINENVAYLVIIPIRYTKVKVV